MLLYAHLNRQHLSTTQFEDIRERILKTFSFLIDRLLPFLAEANAVKSAILLVQMLKQATSLNSPSSDCQHSIPRIRVWNTSFRVIGESQVFTDSKVLFQCHMCLHDSNIEFEPMDFELQDPDEEEAEIVDIMLRKTHKNAGDKQDLLVAHTPYYPEVSLPLQMPTNSSSTTNHIGTYISHLPIKKFHGQY